MLTTSAESSLWFRSAERVPRFPPLAGECDVEVLVIGGGIAGVTTALRLQRASAQVALVEARTIASGVSGCNTAKVTALQGKMLSTITARHGSEAASAYAAANVAAVEDVAGYAREEGIDCSLERRPAVTFAADQSELRAVSGELDAAAAAGLPVQWRDHDAGQPFTVAGAVWLTDQIGFHPVRYLDGLLDAFVRAGGRVFESTRVLSVDDGPPIRARTAEGSVAAEQVVVATHYPILDRGLFFARLKAQRSYCIAARVRDEPPRAMAISVGGNSRSLQWLDDLVIVGGEGHSAGAGGGKASERRFEALERFASEHWDVATPLARWSAQDPISYDHLPMIGPLVPRSRRLWVASGWGKWGLSGGTFAARILADGILGRDNEWASQFTPTRLSLRSTHEIAELGGKFSMLMALDRLAPAQAGAVEEIPRGEARVVRDGLGKVGVYRDEQDQMHAVSLRCTHLGCLLRFNAAERSWDCPCHGSRFDVDGAVLEGPAVRPLEQRRLAR